MMTSPFSSIFLLSWILIPLLLFSDHLPRAQSAKGKNSTIKCEKPDKCTCPGDPVTERYSDPKDPSCDRYYLCHMGNAFLKHCDVRQAFHPEKRECLPRASVSFELCPTAVECVKNGYLPDAKDCTMYYMCFYRQAYHYGCKADHYYDPDQEECVKDAVKAISCDKARSEDQPETSYPPKHSKRMLDEFVEPLPNEEQHQDPGTKKEMDKKDVEIGGESTSQKRKSDLNPETDNTDIQHKNITFAQNGLELEH